MFMNVVPYIMLILSLDRLTKSGMTMEAIRTQIAKKNKIGRQKRKQKESVNFKKGMKIYTFGTKF